MNNTPKTPPISAEALALCLAAKHLLHRELPNRAETAIRGRHAQLSALEVSPPREEDMREPIPSATFPLYES